MCPFLKIIQVIGSLAVEKPVPGQQLSGILVKRNFSYHLMSANDLSSKLLVNVLPQYLCNLQFYN